MIDEILWQQTVLMWARWWIEHPWQYRVFKVFDLLRTGLLYLTIGCLIIPVLPMLVLAAGGVLFVAAHWLLFQLYAHFFVKPAFMSYLLRGRSLEDFRATYSCPGSAYLPRDLWGRAWLSGSRYWVGWHVPDREAWHSTMSAARCTAFPMCIPVTVRPNAS